MSNTTALDRFRDTVDSLEALGSACVSHASRRVGGPPTTREAWSECLAWLARLARESDALAQVVQGIGLPPLYQTDGEAAAAVYRKALVVMSQPYNDVVGRSMPDAGRPSSYRKEWTRAQKLTVLAYLKRATHKLNCVSPGYGWGLEAIAKEERVALPRWE